MNNDEWLRVIEERKRANEEALKSAIGSRSEWKLERFGGPGELNKRRLAELVKQGTPFVVAGMGEELAPCGGVEPLRFLLDKVGKRQVPVETKSGSGDDVEVMTVEDLVRRLGSEQLYMYDVPIAKRLSVLFDYWKIPSVFCADDFLKKTRLPHAFTNWPTLFIGATGSRSLTHVDRWHGHFWMLQISGTKRWSIWPEAEQCLLSPQWSTKYDPSFPPVEQLEGVGSGITFDLKPGELLFVPGGCPHAVRNLDVTVAMAGNFVNATNIERVLADLSKTRLRYADDNQLFEALSEIDFEEEEEEKKDNDDSAIIWGMEH